MSGPLPRTLPLLWSVLLATAAVGQAVSAQSRRDLLRLVQAVQDADFRAELDRLLALGREMEPYTRDLALAKAAYYWRGFALWRRALHDAVRATT